MATPTVSSDSATSLPTVEEIEVVDGLLGSVVSALDVIASALNKLQGGDIMSVEEYLARRESDEPVRVPLDRDVLARLCVFATGALVDVERITELAQQIQKEAMFMYDEETPSGEIRARNRRIAGWHRIEAERRVKSDA